MNAPGHIPLSQDAALVLALAGTAMLFSCSVEDQAERWLRALRLHGQVGTAMQALGVSEAPLMTGSEPVPEDPGAGPPAGEAVDLVACRAAELARLRRGRSVCTIDVFFALLEVYGRRMDRALYIRGTSREELIERLPGGVEAGC